MRVTSIAARISMDVWIKPLRQGGQYLDLSVKWPNGNVSVPLDTKEARRLRDVCDTFLRGEAGA